MINRRKENLFKGLVSFATILSMLFLVFIVYFISGESWNFFKEYGVLSLISDEKWRPVASEPSFSIVAIIMGTLYTSALAVAIALPVGIGSALFIAIKLKGRRKEMAKNTIGMLSGIPSVVYGFIGLLVVVGFLKKDSQCLQAKVCWLGVSCWL